MSAMIVRRVILGLLLVLSCAHGGPRGSSTSGKTKKTLENDEETIQGKIVGGKSVSIVSIPYMVSVSKAPNEHFCGGSIVHPNYILTAAHCVQDMPASKLFVRSGSTAVNSGGQKTGVKNVIIFPKYNAKTVENDVALLETTHPITVGAVQARKRKKVQFNYDLALLELGCPLVFDNSTQIIRIADIEPTRGLWALVTGWGVGKETSKTPMATAQAVWLPTLDRATCSQAYANLNRVTTKMICAGYLETGGKDACQGDSGGPMVVGDRQAGVVSWGKGCARAGSPGIFTNLAHPEINSWVHRYVGYP